MIPIKKTTRPNKHPYLGINAMERTNLTWTMKIRKAVVIDRMQTALIVEHRETPTSNFLASARSNFVFVFFKLCTVILNVWFGLRRRGMYSRSAFIGVCQSSWTYMFVFSSLRIIVVCSIFCGSRFFKQIIHRIIVYFYYLLSNEHCIHVVIIDARQNGCFSRCLRSDLWIRVLSFWHRIFFGLNLKPIQMIWFQWYSKNLIIINAKITSTRADKAINSMGKSEIQKWTMEIHNVFYWLYANRQTPTVGLVQKPDQKQMKTKSKSNTKSIYIVNLNIFDKCIYN